MKKPNANFKQLLGALALSSVSSFAAPTLFTNCPTQVKHPEGLYEVYMDEDCNTAYIPPPDLGTFTVTQVQPLPAIAQCADLADLQTEMASLLKWENVPDESLEELDKRLAEFRERLRRHDELFERYMTLGAQPGAKVNFELRNDWSQRVQAYADLNKGLGIKMARLPVSDYLLHILTQDSPHEGDSLLALGVEANAGPFPESFQNADVIRGSMTLSLTGSCYVVDAQGLKNGYDARNFMAHTAANYSYKFKIMDDRRGDREAVRSGGGTYEAK